MPLYLGLLLSGLVLIIGGMTDLIRQHIARGKEG